jgi:preprotein translocase subunit SecG
MNILLVILLIVVCAALAFFVLIQNPKGGGLSGSFSSLGQQMMGAQQSTDSVEKGTWILAGVMGILCLLLVVFSNKGGSDASLRSTEALKGANVAAPAPVAPIAPAGNAPTPNAAAPAAPAGNAPTPATAAPSTNAPAPAPAK